MYRLQFLNRIAPKEPVVVNRPSVTIGRDATCEIQLPEKGIDDRHARIERRGDGYYLCDLSSSSGSFVNDQRIVEHRLTTGDELEVGGVRMRFEIAHGVSGGSPRRPLDLLQVAAVTVVVLVISGQVALLSSIFSESRPTNLKVTVKRGWRGDQAMIESAEPAAASAVAAGSSQNFASGASVSTPETTAASRAMVPSVLNRMIRIVRVDRSGSGGVATLTIQAKAQVGERELDTRAVAICVQFATTGPTQNVLWRDPIWLKIPVWENFKNKLFTVRFPGAASEMAGFAVRTYYRKQLQDIAVAPSSLQPPPPSAMPGGVP